MSGTVGIPGLQPGEDVNSTPACPSTRAAASAAQYANDFAPVPSGSPTGRSTDSTITPSSLGGGTDG